MKKVSIILATISLVAGVVAFGVGQIGMSANAAYWWTETYTQMKLVKNIGLILILCGIVDAASLFISAKRSQKIVQDVKTQQFTTKNCTNCGLTVSKTVKICPKCKKEV